ncbi:alpha-soluble NSF attachment protein [Tritrichomonas foetus]|uniref:Alpha-soluble NSF attachment protein n=1 Tax=Tritrichomonas foetus TaxID=1144522 RepID=A0A1J4K0R6_9EUKA|nr:alpha-soluble NSF attachment protein [Tritrichomonas foetus]|eukprot:OHT04843.1 alpha-soluble NSF attachment protein [Tritrichomonas foetus]
MSTRGDQLAADAEKLALKKPLFGKTKAQQQASDKYVQAGNAYKIDHCWKRAGECHMKATEILIHIKENNTASEQAIEAAKCFAKDPEAVNETVDAYQQASKLLLENERKTFDAGQALVEAGNVLISADRADEGIAILEKAVGIFKKTSDSSANIAKNYEKLGDILTEKKQYLKAVEFYQNVVDIRLGNAITQGAATMVFFKAVLAYLQLNDIVGARKMLDEHLQKNPVYRNDFHYKFLVNVIQKMDDHDQEGFDEVTSTFGRQCTVDAWTRARLDGMRAFVGGDEAVNDLC